MTCLFSMELFDKVSKVKEGELNALTLYIELKQLEIQLSEAIKDVQPLAIDEALKYPEKSFVKDNAIIEKRSTPSTWDFSGVLAYEQAKKRLKYIEDIAKAGGGYDTETTEEIGNAVKIEGKQTISIKFNK